MLFFVPEALKTSFSFCPTKKKKNYFQFFLHFWCDGVLLVIHEMGGKKLDI